METGQTGTPPTGPKTLEMKVKIWHWVLQQGLGVVILLLAVWHSNSRQSELETKLQQCQESKIEALTITVENNTRALEAIRYEQLKK